MLIRKFDPEQLDSEPDKVLYKDLYPWDNIEDTPFGASLAIVEPGGQTMLHSHVPDETFIIFQGQGIMIVDEESTPVAQGDVVVMPSGSEHTIKNESESEPLMFLSVFWWTDDTDTNSYHMFTNDEEENLAKPARLIFPSPPTSNGPLHVGHLAGPYIMADVIRRYETLLKRTPPVFLCLTDDHQSYTQGKAQSEGRSVEETCEHYSNQIQNCLRNCLAEPDLFISPSRDQDYKNAVQEAFSKLHDEGHIKLSTIKAFYCDDCERSLFDGHVVGYCPHCGKSSMGFCCELCCLPNNTVDLDDPSCTICDATPRIVEEERLVFPLDPFKDALSRYHSQLKLTPRLRRLSSFYSELEDFQVQAAVPSDWGIPVPLEGHEGQVISPWLEIGLANHHLRERVGRHGEILHSFGYDNAFCYLATDPALSLALDPDKPLAKDLTVNEYLSLNDVKMSTSKGHYLSPDQLISRMPIDLLRFYLALVRPESSWTSCGLQDMQNTVNSLVIGRWQDWLVDVGQAVTNEFMSKAPEFEEWAAEHSLYYAELTALNNKARMAYDNRRLQMVCSVAMDLVNGAIRFGNEQSHLAGRPALAGQRATGVALSLAAARLLAIIMTPIMPNFGAQLWKLLGNHHPMVEEGWPKEVRFLAPGQRILARAGLCKRRLFPQEIDLQDMIEAKSES